MSVTADTNFLISATQWDNSVAFKLLKKLIEHNIKIFTQKKYSMNSLKFYKKILNILKTKCRKF